MPHILILHGPNLNLLGQREPGHYGNDTLDTINQELLQLADAQQVQLSTYQSNHEGELVERIHQAFTEKTDYIIINPAAFTHTSVAIRDALAGTRIPFIEVHLSNVHARETFRQHSYFSELADGVISGLGKDSYRLALIAVISRLNNN